MRITFIQPAMGHDEKAPYVRSWQMEPLAIAALAGMTPPEHAVRFFDDRLEPIAYDEATDLVAISVETYTAHRAYQIARVYRARGIPVIMGGYHATLMPAECRQYADAVLVGDAEGVWPNVLADAEQGRLQRKYCQAHRGDVSGSRPDRRIYAGKRYMPLGLVEAGRGCSFACDFCSITSFYQQTYRPRTPVDVARDIAESGHKRVFLVDDNLTVDPEQTKQTLREIMPLGVRWASQASIQTAYDPELLQLMAKSGCTLLLVGFESLSSETLKAMNKGFNQGIEWFAEATKRFRDHGIKLYATFVFGYDTDTLDLFDRTLAFALEQKFCVAAFNHLQPFPGTPLYATLEREGRLLFDKWWLEPGYRFGRIAFRPKQMDPDELHERLMVMRRRFFSYASIGKRSLDLRANMKGLRSSWLHLTANLLLRRELSQKWATPLGDAMEQELHQPDVASVPPGEKQP